MANKKTHKQTCLSIGDEKEGCHHTHDTDEEDLIRFLRGGLAAK